MKRSTSLLQFLGKIEGLPVATVLAVLFGVFIITSPQVFSGYRIYMSFLQTVPPQLILALGLTFIITAGEIDLSFSAVVAFSGFVFAWAFKTFDAPWGAWLGLFLALTAGALVGYINGILVARIGVPAIMATLAAQFFWNGLTVLLAGGLQLDLKEVRESIVHTIFVGRMFGIVPAQALWAMALTVLFWFILNRHKFGEAVMFIGDNANVARVMGINVERTKIQLFTLNGVIAAFAGVVLTLEMNVFWPTQGAGYLLPVMAAVFVGGTSISGGAGSMIGTFFGAYIIGSLEAGVVASGITSYWTRLVEGLVMAASVILNGAIEHGGIRDLSIRLRHWVVPVRVGNRGDAAIK
jgi:simple sugar transport system permease protein